MKKITLILLLLASGRAVLAQSADEQAIRQVMEGQIAAWNKGDLEAFMKGYWNSDSLAFVGHTGITRGYLQTLEHYKKTYNSPAKMGKLFFNLISLKRLSADYYFVTGKFLLKRTVGDADGYYALLFRKIRGQWLIVVDHTS